MRFERSAQRDNPSIDASPYAKLNYRLAGTEHFPKYHLKDALDIFIVLEVPDKPQQVLATNGNARQ